MSASWPIYNGGKAIRRRPIHKVAPRADREAPRVELPRSIFPDARRRGDAAVIEHRAGVRLGGDPDRAAGIAGVWVNAFGDTAEQRFLVAFGYWPNDE